MSKFNKTIQTIVESTTKHKNWLMTRGEKEDIKNDLNITFRGVDPNDITHEEAFQWVINNQQLFTFIQDRIILLANHLKDTNPEALQSHSYDVGFLNYSALEINQAKVSDLLRGFFNALNLNNNTSPESHFLFANACING